MIILGVLFTSDHVLAMRPRVRNGRYSFRHAPASVSRIAKNKPWRRESAVDTVPLSWLAAQL